MIDLAKRAGTLSYKEGFLMPKQAPHRFDNIQMSNQNSPYFYPFFQLLIAVALLLASANGQCCLGFSGGACISCPAGMHLYRGNCIYDLAGCESYLQGFDCSACRSHYQLANGSCSHPRFPPAVGNGTNFTVYLQSALRPDPQMAAAHHALENSSQLWADWYTEALRLSQTYLNSRSLARTAAAFMKNATGSGKIHYIFTGTAQKGSDSLLLYRFIYELSLGGGFADCLVAVEMLGGQLNYLELNEVKMKKVDDRAGWAEVRTGAPDEAYILARLTAFFPAITGYGYLKGYFRNVDEGVNYTMFFMSSDHGVLAFIYLAEPEELPSPTSADAPATASSPEASSSKALSPADSPQTPPITNPDPAPQANSAADSSIINRTSQDPPGHNSSSQANSSFIEILVNYSNLNSNPIYAAGYAVIVQQYGLSPSCLISQLFSIASTPTIYGFYLQDSQAGTYYRFAFTVDLSNGLFEIENYTQADRPLLVDPTPAPSTNHTANGTRPSDNSTRTDHAQANFASNSSQPNSPLPQFCGKTGAEYVDITNKQGSDIFLPKINLLLHTMYESLLANTRISSARYSLALDPAASNSSITYQISYLNTQGTTLNFEVAIVNNEFQLISFPNTTINSQETPKNNEEKAESSESQVNALNGTEISSKESQREETATASVNKSKTESVDNKNETVDQEIPRTTEPAVQISQSSTSKSNTTTDAKDQSNNTQLPTATPPPSPTNTAEASSTASTANSTASSANSTSTSTPPTGNRSITTATNDSPPAPSSITIPAKNYTTQPKYKSLISILRSIYRIPMNASVTSMLLWNETAGDNRYQIAFRMNYVTELPDGTTAKISTYDLSVNPSSFVSVHSETIDYIKKSNPAPSTPAEPAPPAPAPPAPSPPHLPAQPLSSSLPLPSSLALLGAAPSPYLRSLFEIFTRHSPVLSRYSLQSLSSSSSNSSGAIVAYSQKLQFSREGQKLCFSAWYEVASLKNGPPRASSEVLINMLEYHAVSCSSNSAVSPPATNFANEPIQSQAVNAQLLAIAKNRPLTFSLYQRWRTFYRARFASDSSGEREVLLDSASALLLRYVASSKPLFSQETRDSAALGSSISEALRSNMQKIFRLKAGSLALEWVGKSNEEDVMLLEILGRAQVQAQWLHPLYQQFTMQAVFWPSENYIKIVSATTAALFSAQYALTLSAAGQWKQIRPAEALTSRAFAAVLPSLAAAYAGFLQNSQIVAIYREASAGSASLSEYLSAAAGARMLVGISKQSGGSFESGYLLKIRFSASSNQTHIQNIESLPLNSIVVSDCLEAQQSLGLPQCQSCKAGYRLKDGFCHRFIENCEEYAGQVCVRCKSGDLLSKDLRKCVGGRDEQEILDAVVEAYRSATAQ